METLEFNLVSLELAKRIVQCRIGVLICPLIDRKSQETCLRYSMLPRIGVEKRQKEKIPSQGWAQKRIAHQITRITFKTEHRLDRFISRMRMVG